MSLAAALPALGVSVLRDIAAGVLNCSIDWRSEDRGFCQCPGARFHSTRNGRRDCMVALDGIAAVTCVHSSCSGEVAAAAVKLRSAIGRALWNAERGRGTAIPVRRKPTPEETARERRKTALAAIGAGVLRNRSIILRQKPWTVAEMEAASPLERPADRPMLIFQLFPLGCAVWTGGKFDSGHPRHAQYFRAPADLTSMGALSMSNLPGPHLSCAAWRPGSFRRCRENLAGQPFLLVESDALPEPEQCALARWLIVVGKLRLRAAIHSGKRSIHFWFDRPTCPDRLAELMVILPALGCDSKPLGNPAGISRLPGIVREDTGREQRLLYLDPAFSLAGAMHPAKITHAAG